MIVVVKWLWFDGREESNKKALNSSSFTSRANKSLKILLKTLRFYKISILSFIRRLYNRFFMKSLFDKLFIMKSSLAYTTDQQLSPYSWRCRGPPQIGILWSSPLSESRCSCTHHPPSSMASFLYQVGLVCALFHEQLCYSHLPQQEDGLPIEFLHLELSCCGHLARHYSDTNLLWSILMQRETELKAR